MRILSLMRWEWFKLQRRRMPWVLLAILLGFTQLAVWGSYVAYANTAATGGRVFVPPGVGPSGVRRLTCNALRAGDTGIPVAAAAGLEEQCRRQGAALARQYQALSATGGAASTLGVIGTLGMILFGILTASVVGSEYGVGTLRPILSRGTGRLSFLAGKYLMLIVIATVVLISFSAAGAGSGLLAAHSAVPPPAAVNGFIAADSAAPGVGASFVKNWGALAAFITMTAALTLLLRSTAAGMAICLAWFAGEGLLIRLLSTVFSDFDKVADYLPMRNISALTNARGAMAPFGASNDLGIAHASLVLATYVLVFASAAALVFRRRDIAGAAGG